MLFFVCIYVHVHITITQSKPASSHNNKNVRIIVSENRTIITSRNGLTMNMWWWKIQSNQILQSKTNVKLKKTQNMCILYPTSAEKSKNDVAAIK